MIPVEPECWSWPVRPVAELVAESMDAFVASLSAAARELILEGRDEGLTAIGEWQKQRCAICGQQGSLVLDHDHATALIRGYLCRSCNVREARSGGVFDLYRQRNPATILGVREQYWNDVAEALNPQSLQPTPPPTDRWRKNPASGIGL